MSFSLASKEFGLTVIRLARFENVIFPLMALFVGTVAADNSFDTLQLLLAGIVVVLLHSAASIWNDMCDRDVDAANGRPYMKNVYGTATYRALTSIVVVLIVFSLIVAAVVSPVCLLLAVAALATSWLYNTGPYWGSRRPIASIVLLSITGSFLPFLIGYWLVGDSLFGVLLAAFWWLARASVSLLKDYKDAAGDARHHKKTFLLVFGATRVAIASTILFVAGWAGLLISLPVVNGNEPIIWGLVAIGVLIVAYLHRHLFRLTTYKQLHGQFILLANLQLSLEAGLFAWLMLS